MIKQGRTDVILKNGKDTGRFSGDGNRVIGEMRGRSQLSIYEKAL